MTGEQSHGGPPPGGEATVRVLVVDDQELVREGIASLLAIQPGIAVVATARDGREALEAAVEVRPDVALVDVRMPGMDGIATAEAFAGRIPSCRVMMLTTFDDRAYVAGALKAGAVGYLLKNLPAAELARAVRLVHAGVAQLDATVLARLAAEVAVAPPTSAAPRTPLTPSDGGRLASSSATPTPPHPTSAPGGRPAPGQPAPDRPAGLSGRETEVLRLIATGATNREIAGRLHLSEGTVKNHISRILTRLHLRDRTQAALYAHDQGLL
ncbi:response regulator [Kitasatospora sp. NPDC054939]